MWTPNHGLRPMEVTNKGDSGLVISAKAEIYHSEIDRSK